MNYVADLCRCARGYISPEDLLKYQGHVSELLSSESINRQLTADEDKLKEVSWLSTSIFLISTTIAIAFLYCALSKRLLKHQTIYDLIASVDSSKILKQFFLIQKSLKVFKKYQ